MGTKGKVEENSRYVCIYYTTHVVVVSSFKPAWKNKISKKASTKNVYGYFLSYLLIHLFSILQFLNYCILVLFV